MRTKQLFLTTILCMAAIGCTMSNHVNVLKGGEPDLDPVEKDGKYGYYDSSKEKWYIRPILDYASTIEELIEIGEPHAVSEPQAIVGIDGKYGLLNIATGSYRIPLKYRSLTKFRGYTYLAELDTKKGPQHILFANDGTSLIQSNDQFQLQGTELVSGAMVVIADDVKYMVTPGGTIVKDCPIASMEKDISGCYLVTFSDNQVGVAKTNDSTWIIKPEYESVDIRPYGYVAGKSGKFYLADRFGKFLPYDFKEKPEFESNYSMLLSDGSVLVYNYDGTGFKTMSISQYDDYFYQECEKYYSPIEYEERETTFYTKDDKKHLAEVDEYKRFNTIVDSLTIEEERLGNWSYKYELSDFQTYPLEKRRNLIEEFKHKNQLFLEEPLGIRIPNVFCDHGGTVDIQQPNGNIYSLDVQASARNFYIVGYNPGTKKFEAYLTKKIYGSPAITGADIVCQIDPCVGLSSLLDQINTSYEDKYKWRGDSYKILTVDRTSDNYLINVSIVVKQYVGTSKYQLPPKYVDVCGVVMDVQGGARYVDKYNFKTYHLFVRLNENGEVISMENSPEGTDEDYYVFESNFGGYWFAPVNQGYFHNGSCTYPFYNGEITTADVSGRIVATSQRPIYRYDDKGNLVLKFTPKEHYTYYCMEETPNAYILGGARTDKGYVGYDNPCITIIDKRSNEIVNEYGLKEKGGIVSFLRMWHGILYAKMYDQGWAALGSYPEL